MPKYIRAVQNNSASRTKRVGKNTEFYSKINEYRAYIFFFKMLLTYISNCDISKLDIGGANGLEIKEGLRPHVGDSLLHTVLPARASARIRHRARGKGDDERRSQHKPWDDVRNTF